MSHQQIDALIQALPFFSLRVLFVSKTAHPNNIFCKDLRLRKQPLFLLISEKEKGIFCMEKLESIGKT